MITLDTPLHISVNVYFTKVQQEIVLLNTRTNKYYSLDEVGARLWEMLMDGKSLREGYLAVEDEFEVNPAQLEQDLLELIDHLLENGLVEIVQE